MYDQLGGGFHRYSVDERWLVPHFEKMLYDNALARATSTWRRYQVTGEPFYARVAARDPRLRAARDDGARGRLLLRDRRRLRGRGGPVLRLDAGARSRRCWATRRRARLLRVLRRHEPRQLGGPQHPQHARARAAASPSRLGARTPASSSAAWPRCASAALRGAPAARAARARRQGPHGLERPDDRRPGRGRTACSASRATSRPRSAPPASCCATLRRRTAAAPHASARARAHLDAYLEDYAYLGEALVDLYEAGGDERCLREALSAGRAHPRATSPREDGGFYSTAAHGTSRSSCASARATTARRPRANAVAAHAAGAARRSTSAATTCARRRSGRVARLRQGDRPPAARVRLEPDGRGLPARGPGRAGVRRARRTRRTSRPCAARSARHYLPNRVVGHLDPDAGDRALPLLAGKALVRRPGRALRLPRLRLPGARSRSPAAVAEALQADAAAPAAADAWLPAARSPAGRPRRARRATPRAMRRAAAARLRAARIDRPRGAAASASAATASTTRRPRTGGRWRTRCAKGCNLVDTSTNYTDGGSERLVGEVAARAGRGRDACRATRSWSSRRSATCRAQNLELAQQREARGHVRSRRW